VNGGGSREADGLCAWGVVVPSIKSGAWWSADITLSTFDNDHWSTTECYAAEKQSFPNASGVLSPIQQSDFFYHG